MAGPIENTGRGRRLMTPRNAGHVLLLFAPVVVAVGVAARGSSPADPPQAEPPKPATAADPTPRTDQFGDPLPDGGDATRHDPRSGDHRRVRDRPGRHGGDRDHSPGEAGVPRSVALAAEQRPPGRARPARQRRAGKLPTRAVVSPDGRYVAVNTPLTMMVWERTGDTFKEVRSFECYHPKTCGSPRTGTRLAVGAACLTASTSARGKCGKSPGGWTPRAGWRSPATASGWSPCRHGDDACPVGRGRPARDSPGTRPARRRYSGIALDHTGEVMAVSPTWAETVVVRGPDDRRRIGPRRARRSSAAVGRTSPRTARRSCSATGRRDVVGSRRPGR